MTTDVQESSTRAFLIDVLPTLGPRQKAVYEALVEKGPLTNLELSYILHVPINAITPRTNELVKLGVVREACVRKCRMSGRYVIAWEVARGIEQLQLGV